MQVILKFVMLINYWYWDIIQLFSELVSIILNEEEFKVYPFDIYTETIILGSPGI